MTDRPILFSAPMVKALLAGTKTQTRRTIRSARVFATPETKAFTLKGDDLTRAFQNASRFRRIHENGWFWESDAFEWQAPAERTGWLAHIGYAPGDRLYVRETWSHTGDHVFEIHQARSAWQGHVIYKADSNPDFPHAHFWPSIHMPREFSRLTLTVTDVRVQRLQDIGDDDAIAEGLEQVKVGPGSPDWRVYGDSPPPPNGAAPTVLSHGRGVVTPDPRHAYATLWNSINGPGSWDVNPWVVVVSFQVAKINIDRMAA